MDEDAAVLGIQLLKQEDDEEDADFLVDPENWDFVDLFNRCSTQWHYGPMGGAIGMRYEGVGPVISAIFPKRRHNEVWTAIHIMERAAMEVMNSKSK
jgi:hypothetical protein